MRVTVLAGGVGGARLARGLERVEGLHARVIGNVGDDEEIYGLHVSPDLDTLVYTMAGSEGPQGWGRADETWNTLDELGRLGVDTTFRIGDRDMAVNLYRTLRLRQGAGLSEVTAELCGRLGVTTPVIPATNDPVRTKVRTTDGDWLDFQEYFVLRGHRDTIEEVRYDGAGRARPAPGVIEAITESEAVVIAPSNPPLSILPIVSVAGIRSALEAATRVVAVSPLFRGQALKGPAADLLLSLGHPAGNRGVVAAYQGLVTDLVVDVSDAGDAGTISGPRVHVLDTRMPDREASTRLVRELLGVL